MNLCAGLCMALAGLISGWDGDSVSGSVALDHEGTNHGVLENGVTVEPGRSGHVFAFDGIDDQIVVPDSASLDVGSSFSITVWFNTRNIMKVDPVDGGQKQVMVMHGNTNDTGVNNPFAINGGRLEYYIRGVGPVEGATEVASNVWYHAAVTYDGEQVRLYLNGELDATAPAGIAMTADSGLLIGRYRNPSLGTYFFAFDGWLDAVQLYDRPLSGDEVRSLAEGESVSSTQLVLNLLSSAGTPIPGQRVDLLRENGSSTGLKVDTDDEGIARLTCDAGTVHQLKVYHNGGTRVAGPLACGESTTVRTESSTLTLSSSTAAPIAGQRVDLLRENASSTGVQATTDASGAAAFEILPGYAHRFKVYHSGGTYSTSVLNAEAPAAVQTATSVLHLVSSTGEPITGKRIDLLRENASSTGVQMSTDAAGAAAFEILPDYAHRFKVYLSGGAQNTDILVYGDDVTVETIGEASEPPGSGTSTLTLLDSQGEPLAGQRVDLLRANGSSTGEHADTDGDGQVTFEILDPSLHRLKVYHNGGTLTTDVLDGAPMTVQTGPSTLTLTSSAGQALAGQRVDLLRENGSSTGVQQHTDAAGVATFEILPGYVHRFKVYHNGGTYSTEPVTGAEIASVATSVSSLTLTNSAAQAVAGQRVDLLRENGSSTGVQHHTDAAGVSPFEILPGYVHRFKVYHNGGTYQTDPVGADAGTSVQTGQSQVELLAGGVPLEGHRVDLLRENGSSTGVKVDTDVDGVATFEILPGYAHLLKAYVDGETFTTLALTFDEDATIETSPLAAKMAGLQMTFDTMQIFPNPANPSTTIRLVLPEPAEVTLAVYSITGQRVRELASGQWAAGIHEVRWDGLDSDGHPVSSGIYLYHLNLDERQLTQRMTLLR